MKFKKVKKFLSQSWIYQLLTIFVSVFAIISSIYVSTLSISLNKSNELESRIHEKREEIYLDVLEVLTNINHTEEKGGFNGYKNAWEKLDEIQKLKPKLYIYGSKRSIEILSCIELNSFLINEKDGNKYYNDYNQNTIDAEYYNDWYSIKLFPYIAGFNIQIRKELSDFSKTDDYNIFRNFPEYLKMGEENRIITGKNDEHNIYNYDFFKAQEEKCIDIVFN